MSIEKVTNIFEKICKIENMSVQLIKIKYTKALGTRYNTRKIEVIDNDLVTLLTDISRLYTSGKKNITERYKEVREYDGTAEATNIYKMDCSNQLVNNEYHNLISSIAEPETEADPFQYTNAYIIEGEIPNESDKENKDRIILISCINPVTTLKTKFRFFDNRFKSIDEKVLN